MKLKALDIILCNSIFDSNTSWQLDIIKDPGSLKIAILLAPLRKEAGSSVEQK